MVRQIFLVGILVCCLVVGLPVPALAEAVLTTIVATPSPVVANDELLVSAFRFTDAKGFEYIELYNTSETVADARNVRVELRYADTVSDYQCTILVDGFVRPQSYITYAQPTASIEGDKDAVYTMSGCDTPAPENFDREIQVYRGSAFVESVRISAADMGTSTSRMWERGGYTASYRKGVFITDFKLSKRTSSAGDEVRTSTLYPVKSSLGLVLREVLPNPTPCSMSVALAGCRPYIKVANPTDSDIILDGLRLRSGGVNERSSIYNTSYLSGVVPKHSWTVIDQDANGVPLAIDKDEAAIWFEDMYGVVTYANDWAPYIGGDTVAHRGKVWALDATDATWKWGRAVDAHEFADFTPELSPTLAAKTLTPCKDGQYRSEETGRCRSIALAGGTLTPCKEGQYRSEETGRCRSVAQTAAAELRPCGDDQFRNPATGRCKKIASADDIVQPCDAGWERNAETNRCRKIKATSMPLADFPVRQVAASATTVAGWWVMAGVVALGAGYAAWEWRHEVRVILRKLVTKVK